MSDVTRILAAIQSGDRMATDELLAIVYEELRLLAVQLIRREHPGQTPPSNGAWIAERRCFRKQDHGNSSA